jgi:Protein of unknown function (DUF4242)
MQTYLIVRRSAWPSRKEQRNGQARSTAEAARMVDVVTIRSYVLEERDRTVGSICIFQALSPEAIRRQAVAADIPIDEILRVTETTIVRPDPLPDPTRASR